MIINDLFEEQQSCPHCGGPMFSEMLMMEKKDACYYKVKASAKVWPSAYASGRLVQCRKKGAGNYGNKSEGVAEGKVEPQVDHRGDVDLDADIEVLGVDYNTGTWKITYNGKPYTVKADYFSREDLNRWQIPDYDVEIINRNGQNIMKVIDWDNEGSSKTDRQIRMVNTIIAYLDTENAQDIQYMAWKDQELDNVSAYEFYNDIKYFYNKDQQKIDQTVQWLLKNMTNDEAREGLADYIKNPVNPMDWNTKENLKKNRPYMLYVAFSYSREGNTEMTPGMNLPKIQLNDPDDEDELQQQLDALFKKVEFKFDAFENKIVELSKKFSLPDPDLGSGMGAREMFWDLTMQTAWPKEYKRTRNAATNILNFKAAVDKYAKSFNSSLIKIGLPGISEYAIWYGVLSDDLTEQQVNYFATPEGFANVANGKIDVSKMINDNMQRKSLEEKLGDNRPKLGSKRDAGKSVRKWRKSRGLDETDQVNEKSVSQAQFRTMAAAAHNPKFAKKVGISQDVAREFNKADKGQEYKKLPARTTEGSLQETDTSRRGFLRGLAAFAASAAVPAPVVKLLSTPTGVASLPIPAGIALLKGIQEHLDQWDPEDDDDYYEAWEDMAGELGFEDEDAGDEYGESAQDKLADVVNLYRENPELAAAQLIRHLQTNVGVSPKEIKPSLGSRADNPNDWRYHDKQKGDAVAGKKESELAKLTRLAAAAQSAANANFQKSAAAAAVKHMGPVQYAKDTPALPAPTKPEFDLAPDLKQKGKVPVGQQYKKDNQQGMGEGEQQKGADYRDPPEADYGDDYQDMVARVKKLAGLGPLKTVYDPAKRVYRNVPTAVQPKK